VATCPEYVGAYEGRPRRRGRRRLTTAIVLLLVLGGLLVVADRVAAYAAEKAVADQVQREVAKQKVQASRPEVTVGGFPFLTQVVAGEYKSISIVLRDVRGAVDGKTVSLPKLDIDAHNVKASIETLRSRRGDVTAETVEGRATLTYDTVAKLINQPGVKLAERGGKLVVTAPLEVLGQKVTVNGTANLSVQDGKVRIRFDTLPAQDLPPIPAAQALVDAYAKQLSITFALPALPFRLAVREVHPLSEGLAITGTAKDVTLNSAA
jgi:hypothetical protein